MHHNVPSTNLITIDSGRIRVGAGIRIRPPVATPATVTDSGRIRVGAGIRIHAVKTV